MVEMDTPRKATPPSWSTVTPRIAVPNPKALIEFLSYVLGAVGEFERSRPSVVTIGDSRIMIGDAEVRGVKPAFLYVYLNDPDSVYARAIERGATSIEAPLDTPYGDRRCTFEDPWGNTWQIALYRGDQDAA